jgi:hypothetical protein
LWGGIGDEFKFHLGNWSKICSSKVWGGLGVRNLIHFNRALLGKWIWQFAMEMDTLWRKAVDINYGSMRDGWCSKEVGGCFGVGVWKCIRRGWDVFAIHVSFEVGDGYRVLFWHDVWCEELPLKLLPELFIVVCGKDTLVAENMQRQNGNILWNILFTRPVQDWEVEVVSKFFELLYSINVRYEGDDKICWIPSRRKSFEVKSYYKILSSPIHFSFTWKSIWKVKVPPRVVFFVWTVTLGKSQTLDNLRKMNIIVMELCYMCKNCGESIDHLFIHCRVATEL